MTGISSLMISLTILDLELLQLLKLSQLNLLQKLTTLEKLGSQIIPITIKKVKRLQMCSHSN